MRDAGGRQSTDGKLALEYVVSFALLSNFSDQYRRHRAEAEVVLRDVGGQSVLTAGGWGASLKAATRMALHLMFRLMRECSLPKPSQPLDCQPKSFVSGRSPFGRPPLQPFDPETLRITHMKRMCCRVRPQMTPLKQTVCCSVL